MFAFIYFSLLSVSHQCVCCLADVAPPCTNDLSFSPDGRLLQVSGDDNCVLVYDVRKISGPQELAPLYVLEVPDLRTVLLYSMCM